jgi:mitochondrial fission protein ELM1
MQPIRILLLSDGRPGHYHLADGVIAAMARLRPVDVRRLDVRRRRWLPGRSVTAILKASRSPALSLRIGYGLDPAALAEKADVVISAGGETLIANVAAARLMGARNIFCGSLRRISPDDVSLVISSYARHAALPRHVVALKPSSFDPDLIERERPALQPGEVPKLAGVLIGGDSGLFHYEADDWRRLIGFLEAVTNRYGTRWIVSTSPRSPPSLGDAFAALVARPLNGIETFIDYRTAGPGTLKRVFSAVDSIVCTEDSSSMISEAVCARLPVVGVSPRKAGFTEDEREYRDFMRGRNWCRFMPLAAITPEDFLTTLGEITPLHENHLDVLAQTLAERLPDLFVG